MKKYIFLIISLISIFCYTFFAIEIRLKSPLFKRGIIGSLVIIAIFGIWYWIDKVKNN